MITNNYEVTASLKNKKPRCKTIFFKDIDTLNIESNQIDMISINSNNRYSEEDNQCDFRICIGLEPQDVLLVIDKIKKYIEVIEKHKLFTNKEWINLLNVYNLKNPDKQTVFVLESADENQFDFESLLRGIRCFELKDFARLLSSIRYADIDEDRYIIYKPQRHILYSCDNLDCINYQDLLDWPIDKEKDGATFSF